MKRTYATPETRPAFVEAEIERIEITRGEGGAVTLTGFVRKGTGGDTWLVSESFSIAAADLPQAARDALALIARGVFARLESAGMVRPGTDDVAVSSVAAPVRER